MTVLYSLATWLLAPALCLALPQGTPSCSSFAKHFPFAHYNAKFLNSTYYPSTSLNVSDSFNNVSFCEIYTSVSYTANDSLVFAIWLPDSQQWQRRFMAVGNGGMAGTIDYTNMVTQLNSGMGFAVAGGDAGHLASQNNDGNGAPGVYIPYLHDTAQIKTWIHEAISTFTPVAKAMVAAYYGKSPQYAYYDGCSTGGAQGFALAQFYPDLFDGIYAGSPGNWYSHLALSFLWNAQHTNTSATMLSQAVLNFTTNAVLDACDALDGVEDRLIEDPLRCHFDIDCLGCDGSTKPVSADGTINCLTAAQISTAKAIYDGPVRSDNGAQLYPGFSLGSEIEWALQEGALAEAFSIPILQNLVYDNLNYNSNTFNWASDVQDMNEKAGTLIDEISPDLLPFRNHGGKMITTQGWADPFNAALWPIEHLHQLQHSSGHDVSEFYNLFMVPGGGHCGAASFYPDVPATYHVVTDLVAWVEGGQQPKNLLSSNPPDGSGRTRKLCVWPATAHYVSGSVDDWDSYECR